MSASPSAALVARLREVVHKHHTIWGYQIGPEVCEEAADALERLAGELASKDAQYVAAAEWRDKHAAEVTSLRAALATAQQERERLRESDKQFVLGWWDLLMKDGASGERAVDILKDLGLDEFLAERDRAADGKEAGK
jgi:hypothetical protein